MIETYPKNYTYGIALVVSVVAACFVVVTAIYTADAWNAFMRVYWPEVLTVSGIMILATVFYAGFLEWSKTRMTVEDGQAEVRLRESLQKLRTVTGIIAAQLDLDPEETKVRVKAVSPDGAQRALAEVSLAECFAEVDALLGPQVGAGGGPSN